MIPLKKTIKGVSAMEYKDYELLGKYILRVKKGTNIDVKDIEKYIKENEDKWNKFDKDKKKGG